jgi:hypothetical protein
VVGCIHSKKASKAEPMLTLRDANQPVIAWDGSVIAVAPAIGLVELYEILRTAGNSGQVSPDNPGRARDLPRPKNDAQLTLRSVRRVAQGPRSHPLQVGATAGMR